MKAIPLFAITALLSLSTSASAATIFTATLTGDQEVGGVVTSASGTATVTLNDAQTALAMNIHIVGLDLDGNQTPGDPTDDVTNMHIHRAPAGVNGGVVFGLIAPNHDVDGDLVIDPVAGTVSSEWDLNEGNNTTLTDELTHLFNQGLYFNVHTNAHPSGEIRGQIIPEPASLLILAPMALLAMRRRSVVH